MAMKPAHAAALILALAADAMQMLLFPLFAEGGFSPFDDGLDLFLGFMLFRTFGWDWAILPTALIEVVPGVDEIPTWTLTTLYLIRKARAKEAKIGGGAAPRVIEVKAAK
jgi:hypothetical protein